MTGTLPSPPLASSLSGLRRSYTEVDTAGYYIQIMIICSTEPSSFPFQFFNRFPHSLEERLLFLVKCKLVQLPGSKKVKVESL